jgi:hypothetical protein
MREVHMNKGRVGEDWGSKETDGCPLTLTTTFKDLIDLSGYTDPIAIVLKFRRGLNLITQDRIAKSGMDRLSDTDFNSWFKAAQHLDLNRLVNEAFHLASRRPPSHSAPTPMTYPALPCTLL